MRWLFSAVYSEIRGLHQSAYILGAFSFGSQILALVRDRLFAHYFGASSDLDVYYAAFKVPDLLFVLFASVLSVYVLIPFVSEKTENGNVRGAQHMLSNVFSAFLIGYVVVAVGMGIFAGSLTSFLFPGFDASQQVLLVTLLRILLLQPFLLGISSLFGVITQLGQRFVHGAHRATGDDPGSGRCRAKVLLAGRSQAKLDSVALAGTTVEAVLTERARTGTLLGRVPKLAEVANYAPFVASDRASAMTGAIANLTCGSLVD